MDNTQRLRNLNRKQPQDNPAKFETPVKDLTQQGATKNESANSAAKLTQEAIDVLSFVSFKL